MPGIETEAGTGHESQTRSTTFPVAGYAVVDQGHTAQDRAAQDQTAEDQLAQDQPLQGPAAQDQTIQNQTIGGQKARPAAAKLPVSPRLLLVGVGITALAGLCVLAVVRSRPSAGPVPFQDLGAGISNATGLRGGLKARWQGGAAQYQLEIEPIDPLQSAGFSYVAANPPGPLLLRLKLLDATGFAVCGKDVLFPYDPSSPGEADRERGQDLLQSSIGPDGKVLSMSAQGILPCTPAQYKQVVYWDFSTNFPALAEQDELMNSAEQHKTRQEADRRAALRRRKTPRSAFYMEGDDWMIAYDASRHVLQTRLNRDFLVTGPAQQSMASLWAGSGALFHYKCDQRSHCALTRAGGGQSLSVTALQ